MITIYSGDNYLQWRKIVEIKLIGHGEERNLYTDPPSFKMNEWKIEDVALLVSCLNI